MTRSDSKISNKQLSAADGSDPDFKKSLKGSLEVLYQRYNRAEWLGSDPVVFVHRYGEGGDREIAGFLCSALAYGRVRSIQGALEFLLKGMGDSPRAFVEGFTEKRAGFLEGFRYRFNTGRDLADLLGLFRWALREWGSLEAYFLSGMEAADGNVLPGLERFCAGLLGEYEKRHGRPAGRGLRYLLAGPGAGGTAKRLCLFLRWMVRSDAVDLGVWKGVRADQLMVPVDVHIARLSGLLGFHRRRTMNARAVREITGGFAAVCPEDPVRYDFALSRVGIVEGCTGRKGQECLACGLRGLCFVSRGEETALKGLDSRLRGNDKKGGNVNKAGMSTRRERQKRQGMTKGRKIENAESGVIIEAWKTI